MMRGPGGLAVLGTDTGIGKTVVTAAILLALRRVGVHATPWKPVATGGARYGGTLVAGDVLWWKRVLKLDLAPADLNPFCFRRPLAPWVAARLEPGRPPLTDRALGAAWTLALRRRPVLVEGIGGVLVPLRQTLTFADWVRHLGIPAVVVARAGLGTINHVALTIEALRRRRVRVAGIILNGATGKDPAERSNPGALESMCGVPVLAVLPRIARVRTDRRQLARLARRLPAARLKAVLG
jgi:dethiobiotin synthetase